MQFLFMVCHLPVSFHNKMIQDSECLGEFIKNPKNSFPFQLQYQKKNSHAWLPLWWFFFRYISVINHLGWSILLGLLFLGLISPYVNASFGSAE
jgi:hypothetical protein